MKQMKIYETDKEISLPLANKSQQKILKEKVLLYLLIKFKAFIPQNLKLKSNQT